MDLKKLIEKQTGHASWGGYAQGLLDGGFRQPRGGRNNDQAHPPIHPVNSAGELDHQHQQVHEFVVRRFLACCSEDAVGEMSTVELAYGSEAFTAQGLTVLERNYLDVYPYDKWESSSQLPKFTVGETFEPSEAKMIDGQTSPPGYLTEPELIGLMDVNGIGTDATMAEHINKIKDREYVQTRSQRGGHSSDGINNAVERGRGQARGRGGRLNGISSRPGGVQEFIPTTLGVALIEGYDKMGFETSLAKPFLRKEVGSGGMRGPS